MTLKRLFALVLVCCLFVAGIPIRGDFSVSANAEEITVESFLKSAYDTAEVAVYADNTAKPNIYATGRGYYHGVVLDGYWFRAAKISFNVEDINTVSFSIGHGDNGATGAGTLYIYVDNVEYDKIDLTYGMNLLNYTLDVSSASTIRFWQNTDSGMGHYVLVDFKVDSAVDSKGYTVPEYSDETSIINQIYDKDAQRTKTYASSAVNPDFYMIGKGYHYGLVLDGYWGGAATASLNVENMTGLAFKMGHVDNSSTADGILKIYVDNVLHETVTLTANMLPQKYVLDVTDASTVRFYEYTDSGTSTYAFVNFTLLSEEELEEYKISVSLGDLNDDKEVNARDGAAVLVAAAQIGAGQGSGLTEEQIKFADINKDNAVNAKDAALILQFAAYKGSGGTLIFYIWCNY